MWILKSTEQNLTYTYFSYNASTLNNYKLISMLYFPVIKILDL